MQHPYGSTNLPISASLENTVTSGLQILQPNAAGILYGPNIFHKIYD